MGSFSADIARYKARGSSGKGLWLNPAVWAIGCYRLGNWLYVAKPSAPVRLLLKPVFFLADKFCEIVMEMCIDPQASIGDGLNINHIGGVHINPGVTIGKNCDIAHRVTIGTSAMGRQGAPTIGDDVYIGTGAAIVGRIRVGSGAKIAANTLVINNVPEGATVMGVPGRVVMRAPRPVVPQATVAAEEASAK